jgi:glycosyltransferase involved in cell wall biosynthesis
VKIVFIGPVPPLRGGIAQHSAQLVTALRARGHVVDVLSWAAQYPAVLYPGRQHDLDAVPFAGTRFAMRWWDPTTWFRAGRAARDADLLLVTWVIPPQLFPYRAVQLGARRVPMVVVVHEPLPHEPKARDRFLTRRMFARSAGALVHAGAVADEVVELAPHVPVAVAPHPPNLTITRSPLPAGPPWKLLFLGHLRPYKGLDIALGAVRHLADAGVDATLTVAGNPWRPPDEWRASVRSLGVDHLVRFRFGYVPDPEMDALLATHHIVVAPYRQAAQSGVVPLALAAGRPVVATDVGGLPEAVHDGVDGIIVPPDDPGAFADGIRRAIDRLDDLAAGASSVHDRWSEVAAAVEDLAARRS